MSTEPKTIPAEVVEKAAITLYYAPTAQREWSPAVPEDAREVCRMRARSVLAEAVDGREHGDCGSFAGCTACTWDEAYAEGVQAGREAAAADIRAEIEKMTKAACEKPLGPDADDYAAIGNLAYAALVAAPSRPVACGDDQESGATS